MKNKLYMDEQICIWIIEEGRQIRDKDKIILRG